ncbi:MAG TPA: dienelactone hydrolase family protein [Armatimonadota bacterium]|jgi:carboxymethylenebutenolidase
MKAFLGVLAVLAGFIALGASAASKQTGSTISFGRQGEYHGYFVPGSGGKKLPGIVMIHEWWGLNSNIKAEADKYGHAGYNVLAVDLFGKVATTADEATKLVQGLDQQAATAQLLAAADYLRTRRDSNGRVGSLGWCFGGGQSLNLALHDPKLNAAVIYYGQPVTDPQQLAKIKAPMLGHFGETDQSIPLARVTAFNQALTAAGVRHTIYTYPGAGHAFANPTNTSAYQRDAAVKANKRTEAFLKKYLK